MLEFIVRTEKYNIELLYCYMIEMLLEIIHVIHLELPVYLETLFVSFAVSQLNHFPLMQHNIKLYHCYKIYR